MTGRRQPTQPAVEAAIEADCRTLRLPTIVYRGAAVLRAITIWLKHL